MLACSASSILLPHCLQEFHLMWYSFKCAPTCNPTMQGEYVNFVLISLFFMTHKTLNSFSSSTIIFFATCQVWSVGLRKGFIFPTGFYEVQAPFKTCHAKNRFVTYMSVSNRKKFPVPSLNMVIKSLIFTYLLHEAESFL
jgi:hypothetical protein